MRLTLLLIALFWQNPESPQYPARIAESNIHITKDILTVKSTLGFKGHEWTHTNRESLKIVENKFYDVLEDGLAVKLTIFKSL